MESVILAASQQRICMASILRADDIVRFVLKNTSLSFAEVAEIIGSNQADTLAPFTSHKAGEKHDYDCGWFAIRTCSPEYLLEKIIPKYNGDDRRSFWGGVIGGFRRGVMLGDNPSYLIYAKQTIAGYAARIAAQLQMSELEGFHAEKLQMNCIVGTEEAVITDLLIRSHVFFPESDDSTRAMLNEIGMAHGTILGLGDFIIESESESGFWNSSFGWVEDKKTATPFDSESDIFCPPGVNGDSRIVSYRQAKNYCQNNEIPLSLTQDVRAISFASRKSGPRG